MLSPNGLSLTIVTFTNTTEAIIQVVLLDIKPGYLVGPLHPVGFFWLHTHCYSISQSLSALLLVAHIYQITQQWVHFKPPDLLLFLEQFYNRKENKSRSYLWPHTRLPSLPHSSPALTNPRALLSAPLSLPPPRTTHTSHDLAACRPPDSWLAQKNNCPSAKYLFIDHTSPSYVPFFFF